MIMTTMMTTTLTTMNDASLLDPRPVKISNLTVPCSSEGLERLIVLGAAAELKNARNVVNGGI